MSNHKVTFDENGEMEPSVENSKALAEAVSEALNQRKHAFWTGAFIAAFIVTGAIALIAQLFTRYTGGAAIALGLLVSIFYLSGAAAGFKVSDETVRVSYEPVTKA